MHIIQLPGSKSIINRALICASLARGPTTLTNVNFCDDVKAMISALRTLGITIKIQGEALRVCGGTLALPSKTIKPKEAGTTTRFIMALSALLPGTFKIDPSGQMRQRPTLPLLKSLSELNVTANCLKNGQRFPLSLTSSGKFDGTISVDASVSSQFLSAVLLISPFCQNELTIRVRGTLTSRPYIAQTLSIMKRFGVRVTSLRDRSFIVKRQQYQPQVRFFIEPDASAASYFFAYAAIFKKTLRVQSLSNDSIQGDSQFPKVLAKMGAKCSFGNNFTQVSGDQLNGFRVRLNDMPDLVQTLAVVALFAQGKTEIFDVANLQFKETNRLQALACELRKLGAAIELGSDFIRISPPAKLPQNKIEVETYRDHRMAMAFGILTGHYKNVRIQNRSVVKKSMPSFWEILSLLEVS